MTEPKITHVEYDGRHIFGDHYRVVGNVRGWCGHRHRSLHAAARCLRNDQSGCRSQGGYSDRSIVVYDGDDRRGTVDWGEYEGPNG